MSTLHLTRRNLYATAAALSLAACGSVSNNHPLDASPPDTKAIDAPGVVVDAAACSPATFAFTHESMGEGNSGQWKAVGFDLDGRVSTAASTDLCQPNAGGSAAQSRPDGDNGIDNAWGKTILPTILGLSPSWPLDVNSAIQRGNFTTLFELGCLPPQGDAPAFLTKLFLATDLGATPKLDGTDRWPVAPELLSNLLDPASSTITFPSSSITASVFDTQANQTVVLRLPLNGVVMNLTLHAARAKMTLSTDRKSASGGLIGGVIKTEELVAEVKKVLFPSGLCSLAASVITQIRQASDIMSDGTQDPTKTCDGISFGIGFEATQAQRGAVGSVAPTPLSCP
jgi:hypothetical protein